MRLFIAIQFNDQMLEALTKLQGVGSFGDIFWAGIAENEGLELYARQLRRALAERGIPFDRKKFSPHITLLRNTRYKNGERIPVSVLPECEMEVTAVSLMKSERGRNGMVYTEVGGVLV